MRRAGVIPRLQSRPYYGDRERGEGEEVGDPDKYKEGRREKRKKIREGILKTDPPPRKKK